MSWSARAGLPGDRVDARRRQEPAEHGAAEIDLDQLCALEVGLGLARVKAENLLDARIAGQSARELGSPGAGDAGNCDAATVSHLRDPTERCRERYSQPQVEP
jgi:hypothetical protein